MRVAIVGTYPEGTFQRFQEELAQLPEVELVEADTQEKFDLLEDTDAIILRILKMPAPVIDRFPSLKLIMRWGAGFDSVDIEEAGRRGVAVCNTPGANAYCVAELTIALMLAVGRKLMCHAHCIHQGIWSKNTFLNQSTTLNNRLVGIIGGGNIGRQVALRVRAFGAAVQYYDPFRLSAEIEEQFGMRYVPLDRLIQTSDIITLHLPLTDATRHIIGADEIARMKDGAILINAARGGLMDDQAVVEAVRCGKLAGAGIDCVEHEPLAPNDLMLQEDNIIVTPHVGGESADISDAIIPMITDNLKRLVAGDALRYIVNKPYLCTVLH